MVSLYKIGNNGCGQAELSEAVAKFTGPFGLNRGTCADQGFTAFAGDNSINIPGFGNISLKTYRRPSMVILLL